MKRKPSIEELEKILEGKCPPVSIEPNGELKMDYEKCPFRIECLATPKSPNVVQHSTPDRDVIALDFLEEILKVRLFQILIGKTETVIDAYNYIVADCKAQPHPLPSQL